MCALDYNLFFLPQPYPEHEEFVSGRWITLTQDGEEGLGGLDRHGEERAGVLALVWQADVTDSDCELLPRRSHQLDSVIPQSYITKGGTRWGSRWVKNNHLGEKSAAAINFRHSVIQTTLSRGRASAPCLQSFEMLVTRCEKHAADGGFTNFPPLHLHSGSSLSYLQSEGTRTTWRDALKCVTRKTPQISTEVITHIPDIDLL